MLELIIKLSASLIMNIATFIIISKILSDKIIKIDKRTGLLIITLILLGATIYREQYTFILTVINFLTMAFIYKNIFNISITKAITVVFLAILLMIVSEIIMSIIIILFFNIDVQAIRKTGTLFIFSNLLVALISFLLIKIIIVREKIRNFTSWLEDKKTIYVIIFFLFQIIGIGMIITKMISTFGLSYDFFINISIMSVLLVMVYIYFIEKTRYKKLGDDYDCLFKYSNEIEDLMEKQKISNHENKNQLITIKSMLTKNNTKIIKYIDSIIEDYGGQEKKWLDELKYIPKGGLKGFLYYKISQMKNENIEVSINISSNIKNSFLFNLDTNDYKHLCRILGVYLDNAIDENVKISDKKIGIEIFKNNKDVEIIISNRYLNEIDIKNIGLRGFSTKGINHGYGLSLVKAIINKNKRFSEYQEITDNYYIQHLIISKN